MEKDKKLLQSQISDLSDEIKKRTKAISDLSDEIRKKSKILNDLKEEQIQQDIREYFTKLLSSSVQKPININIVTIPEECVRITIENRIYTLTWHESLVFVGELRNLILKTINNKNEEMVSVAKELLDIKEKFKSYKYHTYNYDNILHNNEEYKNKIMEFNKLPWYKKMFFKIKI